MDMVSTQAVLVGTGDLDTDSARVTATVARSGVRDAIRADEPAELYLDVMRPGSADTEPEERTIGVLWEKDDLQRLLKDGNADDVSFSFDEGELMRLLDSEVEAHGLRQTALVVSVAVAAAAGGASTAAAAHGPASGTVGSTSSVAVAAAHDEATLTQRGIEVQPASAIHDEVGLAARGVAAPGTHDEATLASRGIEVQPASAIHDEAGLAARGVAAPGTHDEASLASRGIEVQPLPAVHDEAGLASRGIELQPLTSAVHDEATLASRGIEVTPSPSDGGSSFALPSIDATTTGIAAGLAGGLLIITAAGFAVRRNRPIRPA